MVEKAESATFETVTISWIRAEHCDTADFYEWIDADVLITVTAAAT